MGLPAKSMSSFHPFTANPNTMVGEQSQRCVDIMLGPGEFFFGAGPCRIHTLLGSCVAITVWHPTRRIGGMCHYLLATRGSSQRLSKGNYADEAVQLFLAAIKLEGTRPQDYEVKIFGGGHMFASAALNPPSINVSKNNADEGPRLLAAQGFRVKASDLGGNSHRKIYLELWNGDVWVQRGASSKNA